MDVSCDDRPERLGVPERSLAHDPPRLATAVDMSEPYVDALAEIARSAKDLIRARAAVVSLIGPDHGDSVTVGESAAGNMISMPIAVNGKAFGNLELTGKIGAAEFSDADEQVLRALASVAGVTVESAALLAESRRREHWLEATTEITDSLLSGGSAHTTLHLIADRARQVADAQQAVLALRPDERAELVIEVADGEGVEHLFSQTTPMQNTVLGEVVQSGEARLIAPGSSGAAPGEHGASIWSGEHGPAALIPLAADADAFGVLAVTRPVGAAEFSTADLGMLTTFAGHAALTLEYGRAQQDRSRLAVFEDRDRIARDLHDLVVQRLFAIGLGLQGAARLVTSDETSERIAGFVHELDDTIVAVRRTIFALHEQAAKRSISLCSQVLVEATAARSVLGFEPRVLFDGPVDVMALEPVRLDLIAALREALTNVARHAQASSVEIVVQADPQSGFVQLQVTDDGVGIGRSLDWRDGLTDLGESAERHGGTLSMQRGGDGGTRLIWRVPARP
jgi:signal transduction histidine kinase